MPLDPAILFSAVLNGLTTGAVYALVALDPDRSACCTSSTSPMARR